MQLFGKMVDRYHALKVTQTDVIHVTKRIDNLTCLNDAWTDEDPILYQCHSLLNKGIFCVDVKD